MEYTSELIDIDTITKKLKISVPDTEFAKSYNKILNKFISKAEIKGFRVGKAPKNLVESIYGLRIKAEAFDEIINESFELAYEQHQPEGIGAPKIEILSAEEGKPVEYEAKLTIRPKPTIVGFDKIEVEVEKDEINDESVNKSIDYMVKKRAKVIEGSADEKIQTGSIVEGEMELIITADGKVEEPRFEPFFCEVGEESLPQAVENKLIGLKAGDKVNVTETFAEDHENKFYAGKTVEFKITVKKVSTREKLELTPELIKEISNKEQTVEEFRENVKQKLIEQNEKNVKADIQAKVTEFLIEKNPFVVPQNLIDSEIRFLLSQIGMIDPNAKDFDSIDVTNYRKSLNDIAEKKAKGEIIFDRIFDQTKPEVPQADIDAFVKKQFRANSWEELPQKTKENISYEKLLRFIGKPALIEKIVADAKVKFVATKK